LVTKLQRSPRTAAVRLAHDVHRPALNLQHFTNHMHF